MTETHIAIVGAGLSGLTLARILQIHGVDATVYEADPDAAARTQGGSLDIHEDTGQAALHAAGLIEEFRRHVQPQGQHARLLDKFAKVYIDAGPPEGEGTRPEIPRAALRRLLIDSLDPGRIAWGRKVASVRTGELTFTDGATVSADLIVGADGTWSRVRPLLSGDTPAYAGVTHFEIQVPDDADGVVGPGMLFAMSDGKGLMGHGGEHIELGACFRVPQEWLAGSGVDWSDPVATRAALVSEFAGWAPELLDLIRRCEDTITPRQIFALPVGHRWDRVPGVTLLGDAAHVMSPYAGEGANLALLDAAELAQALIDLPGDTETALAEFEERMFARAAASAAMSAQGLEMCFSLSAPAELVAFFSGMGA